MMERAADSDSVTGLQLQTSIACVVYPVCSLSNSLNVYCYSKQICCSTLFVCERLDTKHAIFLSY